MKMEFNGGDIKVEQSDWTLQPMAVKVEGFMAKDEKTRTFVQHEREPEVDLRRGKHSLALTKNELRAVDPSWQRVVARARGTPQAYRFKDIYDVKKKQQLRKCLEEERKQREFHSRPAPNFREFHERQAAKPIVHNITQPITPNVLKNSVKAEIRRRQRVEETLKQLQLDVQKQCPKTKPIPRSSTKSARPLLKPLNSQPLVEPRIQILPFNLTAEERVQKRRLYNAQVAQMQEARIQQQKEQRLRAEREDYQKYRQLTTFRARPNPFGSSPR